MWLEWREFYKLFSVSFKFIEKSQMDVKNDKTIQKKGIIEKQIKK